jgi:hypothetical protein
VGPFGAKARLLALAATMVTVVAGCTASAPPPPVATSGPATATPSAAVATQQAAASTSAPAPTPKRKFPHGLYIVRPSLQHPGGTLEVVDGDGPLPVSVEFFGTGYDVNDDFVIGAQQAPPPQPEFLTLFGADGSRRTIPVKGLYGMGRPSLSPDGKFVVVQATETPVDPAAPMPKYLADYVIDLATGSFRRVTSLPAQEVAEGRELPKWFPSGDRILYQTNDFSGGGPAGCDVIRIIDAATGQQLLQLGRGGPTGCYTPSPSTGPRFHAEVSLDSSLIVIPGQMQIYDAKSFRLVADIRTQVLAGLAAAGYKPDTRFPGQGNGGTFPLDGTFSPDNKRIVFDGAVEKDGQFGVILCQINVDGTGFSVLRPPVRVEPKFSNDHNYSQVLPRWR